ncbi:MAG: adenylate/guanylate cyclase domain-containing protein [Spirochaetia bacterium]|nr:HAMP domain-containing protein [Spirochaetota bacterium]MCX8096368.1 HAMP domain-containing protein [Spirochaetota bacterium]MDW8113048.1 adenylate/guanylate cyclase domain-containing protein [Spirochaetia bacterium]
MNILLKVKIEVFKNFWNRFGIFRRKRNETIRRVLFGVRFRLIFGFSLIFFVFMLILLVITYFYQYNLLLSEKVRSVNNLSKVVGGVFEILLEKSLDSSSLEIESQKRFVESNIENFVNLNEDVLEVVLTDRKGKRVFSRGKKVVSKRILDTISRDNREQIISITVTNAQKSFEKGIYDCRVISLPIQQTSGLLVSVNEDFDRYVKKMYEVGAGTSQRERVYELLRDKYKEFLNEKDKVLSNDIDYLFLNLYRYLKDKDNLVIPRNEMYLLNHRWLLAEKKRIEVGIKEGNLTLVKNSYDKIFQNLSRLREYGERSRFIGFNVVAFNITSLSEEISNNLMVLVIVFLSVYVLSVIIIFVVSRVYVENIKKLESWGIEVSKGNLSAKVEVKSNDEIGRLSDVFNYMLDEIVSRYHLEKFVSKSTVSMIKDKRDKTISLGKVGRKNLAFLFSDVRGFTSFSEKNDPEVVVEVLNTYLDIQARIIKKYKGDIDDFVGDQIMAHFSGEKRADTAVKVAIEIVNSIKKLNEERQKEGLPTFEVGVGIHIGDVVVGNVGSEFRMDFACVGDAVNTCSRLCSVAKPMEIIASKDIIEKSSKNFNYQKIPPIPLKGKEYPYEVYSVIP